MLFSALFFLQFDFKCTRVTSIVPASLGCCTLSVISKTVHRIGYVFRCFVLLASVLAKTTALPLPYRAAFVKHSSLYNVFSGVGNSQHQTSDLWVGELKFKCDLNSRWIFISFPLTRQVYKIDPSD